MNENWRVIVEAPRYSISNLGRVWSAITDCEIQPRIGRNGYLRIGLHLNIGSFITREIHRLVAEAFVAGYECDLQVNHIDGVKTNNCANNLEWTTGSENTAHAYRLGLARPRGGLKPNRIRIVETGEVFESIRSCARAINGQHGSIRQCLYGNHVSHKGYTFELMDGG